MQEENAFCINSDTISRCFIKPLFYSLFQRDTEHASLHEGHLALSGLQVRGHAMFSGEGMPLDHETLEYAWLVEAIVGNLTGRLTSPQVKNKIYQNVNLPFYIYIFLNLV